MRSRTTNPIESTFATVRLRKEKVKGAGTRAACLTKTFEWLVGRIVPGEATRRGPLTR